MRCPAEAILLRIGMFPSEVPEKEFLKHAADAMFDVGGEIVAQLLGHFSLMYTCHDPLSVRHLTNHC